MMAISLKVKPLSRAHTPHNRKNRHLLCSRVQNKMERGRGVLRVAFILQQMVEDRMRGRDRVVDMPFG